MGFTGSLPRRKRRKREGEREGDRREDRVGYSVTERERVGIQSTWPELCF